MVTLHYCPLVQEEFYIKIYRWLLVDIFDLKLVRYVLLVVQPVLIFVMFVQTYVFIYKFDLDYLIKYGPSYLMTLYVTLTCVCLYFIIDVVKHVEKEIGSWNIENAMSPNVREKLRRDTHNGFASMIVSLILGLLTGIMISALEDEDKHFIFATQFIKYLPKGKITIFFINLVRFFCCLSAYLIAVAPAHHMVYGFIKQRTAAYVIMERMERINYGYENLQYKNLNEDYQKAVSERLVWNIKLHVKNCMLGREVERRTKALMLPFKICGNLIFVSLAAYYFSIGRFSLSWDILRLISLISISLFTLFALTTCGQSVEDLSDEIFDTSVRVKWYHWSQANKKTYLIYLINAQKPFKISFSENISLNYQLAVDILGAFVSALTFVVQLQNARDPESV
ncbi:uncharacterized protein LOC135137672 [Zophobas morio]|uniref:uncharacterized protein LOC135137672 n=1 Tax=Zophobas morio TaxID=2755281 RepID=UPI003082F912